MITVDFKRLGLLPGSRVLDAGCGQGRHTARACREPGLFCVGADVRLDNLAATREKLVYHAELDDLSCRAWALSVMDITALPCADNSFDAVICSEVLEHILDDDTAIEELVRIVKPGGILAVSVPRAWPEWICWQLSDEYRNAAMGHVRIYRKKALIEKIVNRGPRYLGRHYAHSLHTPYWWLKCVVGSSRSDSVPVNLYHRFLVWDLMKKPALTTTIDRLLNPVLGKSLVLYFRKPF